MKTNTIKGLSTERRTRIDAVGPIGKSTWQWDGQAFSGKVEWQTCQLDTTWKETEQSIITSRPNKALPYVLIATGGALSIAGTATYDFGSGDHRCDEFGCSFDKPNNSVSVALMATGGATLGTGAFLTALRPSTEVKDLKTEQKSASEQGSCIQPKDLSELRLVLQISEKKFLSVRVNRDWTTHIAIPRGVQLPRNVDLPVLVYQVPRKAATLLGRWHLVGYARADAEETLADP